MIEEGIDYLGCPLPEGFVRYYCPDCLATCTFECMMMCQHEDGNSCPVIRDGIEYNGGAFGLMVKVK